MLYCSRILYTTWIFPVGGTLITEMGESKFFREGMALDKVGILIPINRNMRYLPNKLRNSIYYPANSKQNRSYL